MKHEDVRGAYHDKKIYNEIATTIECECKDMTERCLRCRVLDQMRRVDSNQSYMDASICSLIWERDGLNMAIIKDGNQKLKKAAINHLEKCKVAWKATKKKGGWG